MYTTQVKEITALVSTNIVTNENWDSYFPVFLATKSDNDQGHWIDWKIMQYVLGRSIY